MKEADRYIAVVGTERLVEYWSRPHRSWYFNRKSTVVPMLLKPLSYVCAEPGKFSFVKRYRPLLGPTNSTKLKPTYAPRTPAHFGRATEEAPPKRGPFGQFWSSFYSEAGAKFTNPFTFIPSEKNPTISPRSLTPLIKVPITPNAGVCDEPGASN